MGWTCARAECATFVAIDEQKACPACGQEKDSWTIKPEQTRTLTIAMPKARLECRRGEAHAPGAGESRTHVGVAWRSTREVSTIPKREARRLAARRLLPAARDLLNLRVSPPPMDALFTVTVAIAFDERPVETRTFELERDPDALDEAGHLSLHFLCVHGPGSLEGIAFPFINVLDVSEETALGHAPTLELKGPRSRKPISLQVVAAPVAQVACSRGQAILPAAGASPARGTAWPPTSAVKVLTVVEALDLQAERRLPDPGHVLRVRLVPDAGRCDLTLRVLSERQPARTLTLELTPAPEDLDDEGGLSAALLCVAGPGADDVRFPWLAVLDVTDDGASGHATAIEVDDGRAQTTISLESEAALPLPPAPSNALGFFGVPQSLPAYKLRVKLAPGIDRKHRLLEKTIDVTLNGLEVLEKDGWEFDLVIYGSVAHALKITLADPVEEGALIPNPPLVTFTQELAFELDAGGWKLTSSLHPRLANAGKGPGNVVTTLIFDPSFLPVTKRCERTNSAYRALRKHIDDKKEGATWVVEDPRMIDKSPAAYLITSPTKPLPSTSAVNVLLFFQNEMFDYPDCDRYDFYNPDRTLRSPPRQGDYGSLAECAEYPDCGWQDQLERWHGDSKVPLLIVFPTVPGPNKLPPKEKRTPRASFGDLTSPGVGVPRLERLIKMLWADRPDAKGPPPALGKLIVGGWSSGMNTAIQWSRDDAARRVDAFFCFDAVGATPKGSKKANGSGTRCRRRTTLRRTTTSARSWT